MLARSVNPSTGEGEASILVYRVSPIKKKRKEEEEEEEEEQQQQQ